MVSIDFQQDQISIVEVAAIFEQIETLLVGPGVCRMMPLRARCGSQPARVAKQATAAAPKPKSAQVEQRQRCT